MGKIFSRSRFTIGGRWAVFGFGTSSAFAATPSAGTTGPDAVHVSMVFAVLMLLAMLVFEAGLFWKAWKNRLPEEDPKAVVPPPQPVIVTQAPAAPKARPPLPKKRTSKQREKALV